MKNGVTEAILGTLAHARVSDDSGVSWYDVGEITTMTLPRQAPRVPANSHDDAHFEQALPGRITASMQMTCQFVPGNQGQQKLVDAQFNQTRLMFRVFPQEVPGTLKYSFTGNVLNADHAFPDNAPQTLTFQVDIVGVVTSGIIQPTDLA